jgi:hypothetical protein
MNKNISKKTALKVGIGIICLKKNLGQMLFLIIMENMNRGAKK